MSKELVKSVLAQDADEHVPAHANLWPAMRGQLPEAGPAGGQRRRLRVNSLALAGALAAVLLALGLLASATLTATQPAPVSAAELLARVEQASNEVNARDVNSFHGVITSTQRNHAFEEFSQVREEQWYLAPSSSRADSHITGKNGEEALLMWVTNGKTGWSYDSYFGRAKPLTGKDLKGRFGAASLSTLLNGKMLKSFYNTEVKGTEQVMGRTTYLLESTLKPQDEWPPNMSPSGMARILAWVDSEAFFVLRIQTWDSDGNLLATSGYESFELNGPVDPALFDAPPPTPTK
ncbi:MAG: outer membrane lipoprotein-sorting protein [Chloroflexota bacterium]|nr:outer membrane lipoprotein-sorting protein [Chloroflexota bacterium]